MNKCHDAILYIIDFNQVAYFNGDIDDDGLDNLETTFSGIFSALKGYRPKKAVTLIQGTDFTNTIYNQTQIDELVSILQA